MRVLVKKINKFNDSASDKQVSKRIAKIKHFLCFLSALISQACDQRGRRGGENVISKY